MQNVEEKIKPLNVDINKYSDPVNGLITEDKFRKETVREKADQRLEERLREHLKPVVRQARSFTMSGNGPKSANWPPKRNRL